tara:strand:- start:4975 stop:5784 length:810 start_codon:yes stop_codon:yes gene_type:complete
MEEQNHQYLTDTHAHLASSRFSEEIDDIVQRARQAGVKRIVSIACDLEDSQTNLNLAKQYEEVSPTIGIHPLYVDEINHANWLEELTKLGTSNSVAAIGEIGLDYFHAPPGAKTEVEWRAQQLDVFERQLELAVNLDLPVVIHQRNSASDVTAVLKQFPKVKAVLHCFTGTPTEAETALEMGHLLSFTGILTFPNANEVREAAQIVPKDRVMVETDCPYLAPVPFRGKRCEPSMVQYTNEALAALHGLEVQEMAEITSRNASEFFKFSD